MTGRHAFNASTRALSPRLAGFIALTCVLSCALEWTSGPAAAQQSAVATTRIANETFEPLHSQHLNTLNVHGSELMGHLKFHGGLFLHYVDDPLVLIDYKNGQQEVSRFVSQQLKAELTVAMGLFEWVELAIHMPLVLFQSGDDLSFVGMAGESISGFVAGDLRIVPKGRILAPEDFSGFGLAVALPMFVPTGDSGTFNSDGAFRIRPTVIADWRHEMGFKVSLNLGYQIRERRQFHNVIKDDSFDWSLGVETPSGYDPLRFVASLHSAVQTTGDADTSQLNQSDNRFLSTPMELDLGARYRPIPDITVSAGAGFGLVSSAGSPDFRLFLGAAWQQTSVDTDGDQCPEVPEDIDDFEDSDGCPDLDHDRDGIFDLADACVMEPEDKDGFEDADGCPDPDNDKDRIEDSADKCPLVPEDRDGYEDMDGCPDPDNDDDGIADIDDSCPEEPEDYDDFEDADGCPEPDNDQDGVPDVDDDCPTQAEVVNGIDDEDGCPDGEDVRVQVRRGAIVILQKVFFATNKDVIKKKSYPILEEVAQALNDNPQITLVEIEGHTDDRGRDNKNMSLSERRAGSVERFLVERGVDPQRLMSSGFGETMPLDTNSTKAGRAANRRVEFTILEVDGKPVENGKGPVERRE